MLGSAGWTRVEFGERSLILEHADLPNELFDGSTVVALSTPAGDGVAGLWTEFAHPNTRLRTRTATHAGIELSSAIAARYLVFAEIGSLWFIAEAAPAIVAELIGRGIERLRERLGGFETPGPWEDPAVQHLSNLTDPRAFPTDLALRVSLVDNGGERLARQLSEMLG